MTSFTMVEPDVRLTFKADKDKVYVLMLLGVEPRDGSDRMDPFDVMTKMGWKLQSET
jgi:hypothetical protein